MTTITAKSKTFLVGEYSVLFGGGAIVLATSPEFSLRVTENCRKNDDQRAISGIEGECPAALFYASHKNVFRNLSIEFRDPHKGVGGFGASSAQFTTLYKLYLTLTEQKFDLKTFLDVYRTYSAKKERAIPPSGADCVAQYQNRHVYFNSKNNYVENLEWNFTGASFSIFKTKQKVATHLHLQQLESINPENVCELNELAEKVRQSFSTNDIDSLALSTQTFFEKLEASGLVVRETSELVEAFANATDGVLAAKGCGAMSADTIVVIHKTENLRNILETAMKMNLTRVK